MQNGHFESQLRNGRKLRWVNEAGIVKGLACLGKAFELHCDYPLPAPARQYPPLPR